MILKHSIEVETFCTHFSEVEIFVNDLKCYTKQYQANKKYKDIIEFEYDYQDSTKNQLKILYSGDQKSQERYFKIESLLINNQNVELQNSNYTPNFNQAWIDSLDPKTKDSILQIVYGNHNSHYGWFGNITYKYYTSKDKKSKDKYYKQLDIMEKVIKQRINWIYDKL